MTGLQVARWFADGPPSGLVASPRSVMKRFVPVVLFIACGPAAAERPVVATAPTAPSPAVSASIAPSASVAPVGKDEVPPSPIARKPIVHRIAANAWNTCSVRNNGSVVCWGVGTIAPIPPGLKGVSAPVRPATIGNITDALEVATFSHASCALRKTGAVMCWGSGTLPNGAGLERAKAAEVPGITGSRISVFGYDLCAVSGSELACFGFGGKPIVKKRLPAKEIVDISGNDQHGCIVTSDGAVFCEGSNSLGAVGGSGDGFHRVPLIADAINVAAGSNFTCAVNASGYRSCWGNGHDLQGGFDGVKYPVVTEKTRNDWLRVGADRYACWIFRDGKARCDGRGDHGQLGVGTPAYYSRNDVKGLTDAVDIAVGNEHACALRANGDVVCWGANDYAQVGDGTLTDRTGPVGVLGLGGKEPPAPQKPGSGPPLALSNPSSPTPSWREPDGPFAKRADSLWGFSYHGVTPTAFGTKAAIFEKEGLALHADHGLVGPITFPANAKFIGLDGDDAVYVGTKDSLLRAADVLAAKKGTFQKILSIPFAVDFATTAGMVVAADARTLHVSKDGGKSFTKITPAGDVSIDQLFARGDGLLAVIGSDKAGESSFLIAKDGVSFVPSKFRPPHVYQSGAYLYAHGCPGAILSSDGVTWNRWDRDYGAPNDTSGWGTPLRTASYPRAFDASKYVTHKSPSAPEPAKDSMTGTPGKCGGGTGVGAIGGGGRSRRRGGACSGTACVRASIGEEPRSTPTSFAFYGDGVCDRDAKGRCKEPWKREPHVWTNADKSPLEVPTGCASMRLLSAGGIGVLFCEQDEQTTAVYTIGKDAKFKAEGTIALTEIDDLTIASDGTLLLHPVCGDKLQGETGMCPPAYVRAPSALGAANAWRATAAGYAYRVLPGGAALIIGGDPHKVSFSIDRAGKVSPWGPSIVLTADLIDVELRKDRVVLVQQMTTRKEFLGYVAADGLVPQE